MHRLFFYFFISLIVSISAYYFWPEKKLPFNSVITKLVVYKSQRKMLAYSGNAFLKSYVISLGDNPIGHKQFQGDERTPEGIYYINAKNPLSVCHKNLGISYPNAADISNARALKMPTGGDIKIHGLKNGQGYIGKFQRFTDWTNGCIAVTDNEIDELYEHTPIGTLITIYP